MKKAMSWVVLLVGVGILVTGCEEPFESDDQINEDIGADNTNVSSSSDLFANATWASNRSPIPGAVVLDGAPTSASVGKLFSLAAPEVVNQFDDGSGDMKTWQKWYFGVKRGGVWYVGAFDKSPAGQGWKGIENVHNGYYGFSAPRSGETCALCLSSMGGSKRTRASNTFTW